MNPGERGGSECIGEMSEIGETFVVVLRSKWCTRKEQCSACTLTIGKKLSQADLIRVSASA